jgi:predicted RND superfamily exporter protein
MLVNILPVLLSFVFLYLLGLSFNIATVMIYSISLGIVVDSSFHLVHAFYDHKMQKDFYVQTLVLPILFSSA